ncbi:MAG: GNAT family N-acetyltransferase [Promethearchaeota archaeon]
MEQDLGDGFIMRPATRADQEAITATVKTVFGNEVSPMVDRLFNYHPDFPVSDHFLVMDTNKARVASYFCLSRTKCVLNGTEFPVGHMEIVATLPEYRHRGLIRRLNTIFEKRVEEYKLPLLVIIGIPYFYRSLGYVYGIPWGGTLVIPLELIPKLKKGEQEPVHFKEISHDTFDEYLRGRDVRNSYLDFYRKISSIDYSYLTHGRLGEDSVYRFYVVKQSDVLVGSFMLTVGWGFVEIHELWLDNLAHILPLLRFLKALARRRRLPLRIYRPSRPALKSALEGISRSKFERPYAWYIRIPSIKRFLETIAPVLEHRLSQSDFAQLSASLCLSWYRAAIELIFKDGNVHEINEINRQDLKEADVAVPFPAIYQLLMGYKTIDDLHQIYPDAGGRVLKLPIVRALFPKIRAELTPDF